MVLITMDYGNSPSLCSIVKSALLYKNEENYYGSKLKKRILTMQDDNYFLNGLSAMLTLQAGHTSYKDDCQLC